MPSGLASNPADAPTFHMAQRRLAPQQDAPLTLFVCPAMMDQQSRPADIANKSIDTHNASHLPCNVWTLKGFVRSTPAPLPYASKSADLSVSDSHA